MDAYWMFLKTVVHTVVSLMGAAAVLFTSASSPDLDAARRRELVRASFTRAADWQTAESRPDDRAAAVADALIGALTDSDADVRKHAAIALGEIGSSRAVKGLIAALADKESEVRRAAAIALGEIGDSLALEPLMRALKDPDASVRRSAVIAIAEIGDAGGNPGDSRPDPNPNPNPNPNPRPKPSGAAS